MCMSGTLSFNQNVARAEKEILKGQEFIASIEKNITSLQDDIAKYEESVARFNQSVSLQKAIERNTQVLATLQFLDARQKLEKAEADAHEAQTRVKSLEVATI